MRFGPAFESGGPCKNKPEFLFAGNFDSSSGMVSSCDAITQQLPETGGEHQRQRLGKRMSELPREFDRLTTILSGLLGLAKQGKGLRSKDMTTDLRVVITKPREKCGIALFLIKSKAFVGVLQRGIEISTRECCSPCSVMRLY